MATETIANKDTLLKHWQLFTHNSHLRSPDVRKEILRSWKRCVENGVDPLGTAIHSYICGKKLKSAQIQHSKLLDVSAPFMKDIYNVVKGTGFVVVLADTQGHILEMFGDKKVSETPLTSNFFIGASWHEKDAGTNAIGTAIEEKLPVQVSGPEHFSVKHHGLTCSAAPIIDPTNRVIGILDISGAYENAHAHTLGMVVAGAKAITAQLKTIKKNQQLAHANNKLVNIFNMVSDGVLLLDDQYRISELNPAAVSMFGRPREKLLNKKLSKLLVNQLPFHVSQLLFNGKTACTEIELTLESEGSSCQYLASSEPIFSDADTFSGCFITLRPVKVVQNLVNRYSGYSASLQFHDIIAQSREMKEVIDLAKLSAKSSSNVLLQGESGTGKEIFAQAIHNKSLRRSGPFIPLNCGAIPRDLVGSELFGYEDGAFTGAKKGGKPGKFELASGGTLFLDEIGDMPLEHQAVLLRVIQEKRMTRIGGIKVIPVDVRLICATHKNLLEKVGNGTFRQDLYYRLNVMSITIPSLRERVEDISPLFHHFLEKLSSDRGYSIEIKQNIYSHLHTYGWPGNVRELQNVVERAANLAINRVISSKQLPSEIIQDCQLKDSTVPLVTVQSNRGDRKKRYHEKEKQQLLHLLDVHDGNISRVSRALGVCRKTIYNRMNRHNIVN